jgi:hypothetical protein
VTAHAAPQAKPPRGARADPARVAPGTALSKLQAKLEVGAASDGYEREADHVAAQVMRGDAPLAIPPSITPLGAQRKTLPKSSEDEKAHAGGKAMKAQRKSDKAAPARSKDEERKGPKSARVQRKASPRPPEDKAKGKVQREAAAGAQGGIAPADVSHAIGSLQAGSAPRLDAGARRFMEGRFGQDFGGVRVHSGPRAAAVADALGARAFTVGNDIFFNRGQYRPHSGSGRQLLAHELTHTIQQSGGTGRVARRRIQRDVDENGNPAPSTAPAPGTVPAGTAGTPGGGTGGGAAQTSFSIPGFTGATIDTTNVGAARGTITLPTLALPRVAEALKGTAGGSNTPVAAEGRAIPLPGETNFALNAPQPHRDDTVAAETWTAAARADLKSGVADKLEAMKNATPNAATIVQDGTPVYYLTFKGTTAAHKDNVFIGTLAELADSDALLRPQWTPNGRPLTSRDERLDADHFLEAQLGGADSGENMWLLQASYNRSVGSQIAQNIAGDMRRVLQAAPTLAIPAGEEPTAGDVDAHWNVTFKNVAQGRDFARATTIFWTRTQIQQGAHLDQLKMMSNEDLIAANIRLRPGERPRAIDVYPGRNGGRRASFRLTGNNLAMPSFFFYGLKVNSATYLGDAGLGDESAPLASLNLTAFRTREGVEYLSSRTVDVTVLRSPRLGIAGYLDPAAIRGGFSRTDFPGLSPLAFADVGVSQDGALTGNGSITSSKAMLPGLQVPLVLEGERIIIRFPIPADRLSLGPVRVTEASLGLGYGPGGLFIEGAAGIEIRSLGSGYLAAELNAGGPRISGQFNLATDFLNPASIAASYDLATDDFTASATLGVQQGRIPGIDSGTVTVAMTRNTVSVNGTIALGGPLRGITVNVTYSEAEGLRIGADNIPLPISNLPAVQNATLSIAAAKPPNATEWSFSGHGTASFGVPGVTGSLSVDYLDGAVTVHGQGTVAKGPATGTLDFTATNRQIDEQGNPVEGPLVDGLNAWGRGSVTVRFGEALTGTAGIEYTPDNRVIVSGTIAMPPVYEVFPRRDYNKDLFTLSPPEFPIWGVSVAGYGVGIFAFVDARVFFEAYVGPGQIRDAAVTATLDLDKPEDATVHGHGEFYVPAYAGLGLDVGGGLRARLAIAYAQGRVGLTGRLGVEAGAGAIVDFDWSRSAGLSLSADLHAEATPKFDISANASVTVGVDLLLTEVEHSWGPWTKQLGSFGPDMTLGVRMPVRWSEAAGLDMSLDNIEITRPQLDATALMTDMFDRLAA